MDEPSTKIPAQSLTTDQDRRVHQQQYVHKESNLVSNGSVDIRGQIADKKTTGGWKASPFIIASEVAERLAFFAIAVNMVAYLVLEMRQSLPTAVTHTSDWIGAAYILTILGAFLADSYLGRFRTIIVFSCIYAVGMVLITLSASVDGLRPGPCLARPCTEATNGQTAFLYVALVLIALGTGGIKPCVSSFGADQFDEADPREAQNKYAFFNWFFFAINMGALLGITLLVYLQNEKGWSWGFGVPTAAMLLSVVVIVAGTRYYRYQKPMGSPFTRFFQVIVAAVRNHFRGVKARNGTVLYEVPTPESSIKGGAKLAHTEQYRFLDKAAVPTETDPEKAATTSPWRLCTVTQVEEFKSFIRVLPVWASTIALAISFAQNATFFVSQAAIMDRKLGPHFSIPAGSVPVFGSINALLLVPIYEKWIVPFLRKRTGHRRGITSLQRMGLGLVISVIAMASGALVERNRRNDPNPRGVTVFWLFPQIFLMGMAEVFTYVGQLEFFYDEATDGTRSISNAMFLTEIGIGSWLNTALIKIVNGATGGERSGWLRHDLNSSRLDNYYWVLTGISAVNFLVYLWIACKYKGKSAVGAVVSDEGLVESGDQVRGVDGN